MASKFKHHLYFCWNKFQTTMMKIYLTCFFIFCETLHRYLNKNTKYKWSSYFVVISWVFVTYQNLLLSPGKLQEVIPNILKYFVCIFHTKLSTSMHVHKVAKKLNSRSHTMAKLSMYYVMIVLISYFYMRHLSLFLTLPWSEKFS